MQFLTYLLCLSPKNSGYRQPVNASTYTTTHLVLLWSNKVKAKFFNPHWQHIVHAGQHQILHSHVQQQLLYGLWNGAYKDSNGKMFTLKVMLDAANRHCAGSEWWAHLWVIYAASWESLGPRIVSICFQIRRLKMTENYSADPQAMIKLVMTPFLHQIRASSKARSLHPLY